MDIKVYRCALGVQPTADMTQFLNRLSDEYLVTEKKEDEHHHILIYTHHKIKRVAKSVVDAAKEFGVTLGRGMETINHEMYGRNYLLEIGWKRDMWFIDKLVSHIKSAIEKRLDVQCSDFEKFYYLMLVTMQFTGVHHTKKDVVWFVYHTIVDVECMHNVLWFKVTDTTYCKKIKFPGSSIQK